MIGPFSEVEEKTLETLEQALIDNKILHVQMMKMYAEFLFSLISSEKIERDFGFSSELTVVAQCVQSAIHSFGTDASDELRRQRRVELIKLCSRVEKEQPALAALARCAVCCVSDEEGWEPDLEEDSTPIPRYLFLLKKFDPNMGVIFLSYARTALLEFR
ncbi:hypothetical protein VLK31_21330 [Variovorax sp. H27-G14]|uniref:hypothetical protein n=1 Tax=Variovorax sp. H27-G14 TaxID=3111914 RepID=UPI0038FD3415